MQRDFATRELREEIGIETSEIKEIGESCVRLFAYTMI